MCVSIHYYFLLHNSCDNHHHHDHSHNYKYNDVPSLDYDYDAVSLDHKKMQGVGLLGVL